MANDSFHWSALPASLLRRLTTDLMLAGSNPVKELTAQYGEIPTDNFVKDSLVSLREGWIVKNADVRRSVTEVLRARRLGSMDINVTTAKGQIDYLRSCRNSGALRSIFLAHLLAAGERNETTKMHSTSTPSRRRSSALKSSVESAWMTFSDALGLTLAQLQADHFLLLNRRDKPDYYLQFSIQGPSGIWGETVSNAYLPDWEKLDQHALNRLATLGWNAPVNEPSSSTSGPQNYWHEWTLPIDYRAVAQTTVETLREVLEVRHPGRLSYKAFAKDGAKVILPNLGIPNESNGTTAASISKEDTPLSPQELLEKVKEVMKSVLKTDNIYTDNDGDIPVNSESVVTYVRVQKDAPIVTVFTPILWDFGSPPNVLEIVNSINSEIRYGKALWNGKGIVLTSDVVGSPLASDQLVITFQALTSLGDEYAKKLQSQFGGKIALGPALPPKNSTTGGYL